MLDFYGCGFDKVLELATVGLRIFKQRLMLFQVGFQIVKDCQLFVQADKCVSQMFVVCHEGSVVEVNCTLRC